MFLFVRTLFTSLVALATLIALSLPPAASADAAAAARGPSAKQIQAAVKEASSSKDLWATFNICNTAKHPRTIGIRGQMLGLGFRTNMSMSFQVEYWSVRQRRYRPIAGATKSITLGSAITGLHQDGVTFKFKRHAGLLAAVVSFDWALGTRPIAHLVRATSKGHPDADNGDPLRFSSGNCRIR